MVRAGLGWVQVNVLFLLIPKLEEEKFSKPWLKVSPEFGMIPPGKAQVGCIRVGWVRTCTFQLS